MAIKPILFSAPMVRALLAGTKTQTRRTMNPQPEDLGGECWHVFNAGGGEWGIPTDELKKHGADYSRFQVGDWLYVREAWAPLSALKHNDPGTQALSDNGFYRADQSVHDDEITGWRPSIHQPRWASRITLIVTDVRIERLQEISNIDALAEGIPDTRTIENGFDMRDCWRTLWTSINGAQSWEANPWIVALTFNVIKKNIDEVF